MIRFLHKSIINSSLLIYLLGTKIYTFVHVVLVWILLRVYNISMHFSWYCYVFFLDYQCGFLVSILLCVFPEISSVLLTNVLLFYLCEPVILHTFSFLELVTTVVIKSFTTLRSYYTFPLDRRTATFGILVLSVLFALLWVMST